MKLCLIDLTMKSPVKGYKMWSEMSGGFSKVIADNCLTEESVTSTMKMIMKTDGTTANTQLTSVIFRSS